MAADGGGFGIYKQLPRLTPTRMQNGLGYPRWVEAQGILNLK